MSTVLKKVSYDGNESLEERALLGLSNFATFDIDSEIDIIYQNNHVIGISLLERDWGDGKRDLTFVDYDCLMRRCIENYLRWSKERPDNSDCLEKELQQSLSILPKEHISIPVTNMITILTA